MVDLDTITSGTRVIVTERWHQIAEGTLATVAEPPVMHSSGERFLNVIWDRPCSYIDGGYYSRTFSILGELAPQPAPPDYTDVNNIWY